MKSMCCLCIKFTHENTSERTILVWLLAKKASYAPEHTQFLLWINLCKFLFTKIKPEYSNILYNPTHFSGPLVCRIRLIPLYKHCECGIQITSLEVSILFLYLLFFYFETVFSSILFHYSQ